MDLKTYSTENKPEIESLFICTIHIDRNQRAKAAPPPQQNHQNRFLSPPSIRIYAFELVGFEMTDVTSGILACNN